VHRRALIFLIPDPRSKDADRLITSEPTLDQGSVVVPCRRTTHLEFVAIVNNRSRPGL